MRRPRAELPWFLSLEKSLQTITTVLNDQKMTEGVICSEGMDGVQGRLPLNMPLWQIDYFELKFLGEQPMGEHLSP